jgi:two-component system, NtrC family, response regulator AtoC
MVLADDEWIKPESFPSPINPNTPRTTVEQIFDGYSIKNAQKIMEKEMIIKALKATRSNRTQAARLLEISHPSLLSKMKVYGIEM